MAPTVLVACSGPKLEHAAPARDLYTSDLFRKSRAWAERFGSAWFILSAKHGLVHPAHELAPYDVTLKAMTKRERAAWSARVALQWSELELGRPVIVLAGADYRAWCDGRAGFSAPMQGLGIGLQLQWLKRELAASSSSSSSSTSSAPAWAWHRGNA